MGGNTVRAVVAEIVREVASDRTNSGEEKTLGLARREGRGYQTTIGIHDQSITTIGLYREAHG